MQKWFSCSLKSNRNMFKTELRDSVSVRVWQIFSLIIEVDIIESIFFLLFSSRNILHISNCEKKEGLKTLWWLKPIISQFRPKCGIPSLFFPPPQKSMQYATCQSFFTLILVNLNMQFGQFLLLLARLTMGQHCLFL